MNAKAKSTLFDLIVGMSLVISTLAIGVANVQAEEPELRSTRYADLELKRVFDPSSQLWRK